VTDLKIGVVGIPGKWSSEVLAEALEARTGFRLIIDIEKVVANLYDRKVVYEGYDLCELDAIIVKKVSQTYSPAVLDRLEILRFVETCNTRVFSKPEQIIRLVDRMACTVTLAQGGIPMPPTIITEHQDAAVDGVLSFGESILKPLFSTKAKGMEVIKADQSEKKIRAQLDAYHQQHGFYYLQKKLDLPGQDLGLMFLGGEYQGAYARVSDKTSWNTSTDNGGKYAAAYPSDDVIEMAQRAQALFNLDFTTVDIAETPAGPVCFEVSAFGGFKGAMDGLGINIAEKYADYVIQQLKQNH
jgi:ribosomal protein S6--L-glutamate ligase